jgi:putative endonuclease
MVNPTAQTWFVYLVRCADETLYTGVATDVERRFREHQAQGLRTARYLRGRGPLELVYYCAAGDRAGAQRLEYRIKQLKVAAKHQLIRGELALSEL